MTIFKTLHELRAAVARLAEPITARPKSNETPINATTLRQIIKDEK